MPPDKSLAVYCLWLDREEIAGQARGHEFLSWYRKVCLQRLFLGLCQILQFELSLGIPVLLWKQTLGGCCLVVQQLASR